MRVPLRVPFSGTQTGTRMKVRQAQEGPGNNSRLPERRGRFDPSFADGWRSEVLRVSTKERPGAGGNAARWQLRTPGLSK